MPFKYVVDTKLCALVIVMHDYNQFDVCYSYSTDIHTSFAHEMDYTYSKFADVKYICIRFLEDCSYFVLLDY